MQEKMRKEYWLVCPICNAKTRDRVHDDTVLVNFPLFCPMCKNVTRINYVKGNIISTRILMYPPRREPERQ